MNNKKLMYIIIAVAAVIATTVVLVAALNNGGSSDKGSTRGSKANVTQQETEQQKPADESETQAADNRESDDTQKPADNNAEDNKPVADGQSQEEAKVYTPTFMYFVSKKDSNYDEYSKIIDELKSEYDGRVTFNIVDIDENPEAKQNFPVDNETTPVLILTNTKNDISAIEFKCADKDKLKADIEAALN